MGFFGPSREERNRDLTKNFTQAKDEEFRKVQVLLERLQEEWNQPITHHCYLCDGGVGATVTWEGTKLRIIVRAGCWKYGQPYFGEPGEPLDGQNYCAVTVRLENSVPGTNSTILGWSCEKYVIGLTEPTKYFDWIVNFLFNSPPMVDARLEMERIGELKRKLGV